MFSSPVSIRLSSITSRARPWPRRRAIADLDALLRSDVGLYHLADRIGTVVAQALAACCPVYRPNIMLMPTSLGRTV